MSLFKGQVSWYDIKYEISFREAIKMRDIRLKRLAKEMKSNPMDLSEIEDEIT